MWNEEGPRSTSSREHVMHTVRERIISGYYGPGDQLKQDLIAAEFGTSPGPVREALRGLEHEGLVVLTPNRGVFVSGVTEEDLLHVLLPVRLTLESYAATHLKSPSRTLSELSEIVQAMTHAAADHDLQRVNHCDLAFHKTLVHGAVSPHAGQLWTGVSPRIRLQISTLSVHHDFDDIVVEHEQLLDALRKGPDSALAVLDDHIIGSARRLLAKARKSEVDELVEQPATSGGQAS